jgi:hypothetical protein
MQNAGVATVILNLILQASIPHEPQFGHAAARRWYRFSEAPMTARVAENRLTWDAQGWPAAGEPLGK